MGDITAGMQICSMKKVESEGGTLESQKVTGMSHSRTSTGSCRRVRQTAYFTKGRIDTVSSVLLYV